MHLKIFCYSGGMNVVREGNKLPLTKKKSYTTKNHSNIRRIFNRIANDRWFSINLGELSDLFIEELVYDPIKKDGFMDIEIAAFRMQVVLLQN